MSDDKAQINFQLSIEEAATVDRLAAEDGFDNRSAWMRRLIRQEIARRQQLALPLPEPTQAVQA